jgi:hypothetical protein
MIGYELLTGSPPVREDGTVRPAKAVVNQIPDGVSTILEKALKPAKMERYASAAAFKRELAVEGTDA